MTQVAKELGIREAAFTQVSDALAQATGKENSHLVIKLKPASLGEVQVDLFVEGGKLNAKLLASTAEVRDAFVRDLPAFKASLEAQGLRIDQVSVAVRAESNFNPQGQGQGQSQPQAWALNRPLTQTAPELASSLSTSAWSGPALNDQLFSALA
jgi:flagellar hook-length control protein FliK